MSALQRILNSSSLPSLPTVAVNLLALTRDPASSTKVFVQTVQSDPAISAKILKLSNSSYLGIRSNVTTLQKAVTLLGTRSVTSMALAFSIARQSVGSGPLAEAFDRYWQQSVLQAIACEAQSDRVDGHSGQELFLAGLMLDIGQLAMLRVLGAKYAELLLSDPPDLVAAEQAQFGFDHAEAGGRLLEQWQFPPMLIETTRRHHDADAGVGADEDPQLASLLAASRVAVATSRWFQGLDPSGRLTQLQEMCRVHLGLDEARTLDFCEDVAERFRGNAELFDADPDALPEPSELMATANEQLAAAAARAALENARHELACEKLEQQKQELASQNEDLRKQTTIDALTKCYNRAFFDGSLEQEVDICRRVARPIALLFIDVDNFKTLNDTYGHQFGDRVLAGVAAKLSDRLRESDVLCRYGGEEFVVLARQSTEEGLRILAERLRVAVQDCEFFFDAIRVPVTVSIGGAHTVPELDDGDVAGRLVHASDSSMYEAKKSGRNRVVVASLMSPAEQRLYEAADSARFSEWLRRHSSLTEDQLAEAHSRVRPPAAKIGEVAVEYGFLTAEQVTELLDRQALGGRRQRIGRLAIEAGWIEEPDLAVLLGLQKEDARDLARSVSELGQLSPNEVATLLDRFRRERAGSRSPDRSDRPALVPA